MRKKIFSQTVLDMRSIFAILQYVYNIFSCDLNTLQLLARSLTSKPTNVTLVQPTTPSSLITVRSIQRPTEYIW